ncbi:NAD(P)-binding protein, partial [Rhizophagus irregularis]
KLDNNYDLSGYVIILTGATDGIGKDMARILAGFNPKRLILPVRNKEKGNILLEYIKSSNGHAKNVEIWEMDLADLQSVKNFANKFIKEDNLEIQFQVNHLAPFLLTLLLLDTIKKSVSAELPGKIAFTSSSGHFNGEIDFDNLNLEKRSSYWHPIKGNYGNTKLMNVIVAKELSRIVQNENIRTYSLHPGIISTNLNHMNNRYTTYFINLLIMMFEISAEQGAINTLYPVLSSENKETGEYYNEGIKQEPNKIANDQEVANKLWKVSEQLLREHGLI